MQSEDYCRISLPLNCFTFSDTIIYVLMNFDKPNKPMSTKSLALTKLRLKSHNTITSPPYDLDLIHYLELLLSLSVNILFIFVILNEFENFNKIFCEQSHLSISFFKLQRRV